MTGFQWELPNGHTSGAVDVGLICVAQHPTGRSEQPIDPLPASCSGCGTKPSPTSHGIELYRKRQVATPKFPTYFLGAPRPRYSSSASLITSDRDGIFPIAL